jgi:hypothetical protein
LMRFLCPKLSDAPSSFVIILSFFRTVTFKRARMQRLWTPPEPHISLCSSSTQSPHRSARAPGFCTALLFGANRGLTCGAWQRDPVHRQLRSTSLHERDA